MVLGSKPLWWTCNPLHIGYRIQSTIATEQYRIRTGVLPQGNAVFRTTCRIHSPVWSQLLPPHETAGLRGKLHCKVSVFCFYLDMTSSSYRAYSILCILSAVPSLHFQPHLMAPIAEIADMEMGKKMSQQLYFKTKAFLMLQVLFHDVTFLASPKKPCVMQSRERCLPSTVGFFCVTALVTLLTALSK